MHVLGLAFLACRAAFGQGPDAAAKLPIEVPAHATVNFDTEVAGHDLIPTLKQLMESGVLDLGGQSSGKIVIKTGLGNVELTPDDLQALLKPVREIHVVSFVPAKDDVNDPMRRQEEYFSAQGMRRVTNQGGFLLMRRSGDRYAAVLRQKGAITIVRVDGFPDLGVATSIVLRTIANGAQHSGKSKPGA